MARPRRTLFDKVRQILAEREIEFQESSGQILVHHGSAEVAITVSEEQATIGMSAVVLYEVELGDAEDETRVLRSLNDRNARLQYGRFYYDPDARRIVHDIRILGSHLQPPELMNGLISVARTADEHDDLLYAELGTGVRAADHTGRSEAPVPF